MSRRVLHIIDSFARTGVSTQCLVLARGLRKKGFDVHVVALKGRSGLVNDFNSAGVETIELDRRWIGDLVVFGRLQRIAARLQPDVIHAWSPALAVYGALVSRRSNKSRLVACYHRIDPYKPALQGMVERVLARRADRLVAGSHAVWDWCAKSGLLTDSMCLIPPGVPPALASDLSRDKLLRELELPADARLIGVVGRLVPEKRVKDLIWAADLLRVLHDNLRLLVIGDGPLRPQLEQYARLASDMDHIRFLGERPDIWRLMPHLDVLWNATEPRGHSLAILEAMSAGVPVIASDTPFNRELVIENETGYLIPLGDRSGRATRARHTDRIFSDAQLTARLAAASRKRVAEHFSDERMVRHHIEVYRAEQ